MQIMKGDSKMNSYNELKKELLKNPEVKTEYETLAPEFDIIQALIDARKQQNFCVTTKAEVEK